MELRDLLKRMFSSYFVIYGGSMLGTLVYCLIFAPDATFSLEYFVWMLLFALAGDLPSLIFYSSKELTERQWRVRKYIHLIVLELVLLAAAKYLELYHTVVQGVVFAGIVLMVYGIVVVLCFTRDLQTAKEINEKLEELRGK